MSGRRFGQIKEEGSRIRRETRERTAGYITAALGLVAGLAWNQAINALIEMIFPNSGNSVIAKFVYAIIVTIVIVVITIYLARFTGNEENSK